VQINVIEYQGTIKKKMENSETQAILSTRHRTKPTIIAKNTTQKTIKNKGGNGVNPNALEG
jgi:hypothetical protein